MSYFARVALLALAFVAVADASAQTRRTDELLRRSGTWKQMGQYEAMIGAGIENQLALESQAGKGHPMDPNERVLIRKAASKAFNAERMRSDVRAVFVKELTAEDEAQALVWFTSSLGTRLTKIEENYGEMSDPVALEAREKAVVKYAKAAPKARLALMRRMAAATNAGELAARMVANTTVAILYGAAASTNGDITPAQKMRDDFEARHPVMVAAMTETSVAIFAYMYRTVSDEDFDRYIQFAESPAGLRMSDATLIGMDQAFSRASLEFGLELGELGKRQSVRRAA